MTSKVWELGAWVGTDGADFVTQTELDAKVSDTAYASSWNGVTGVAASKNAVFDKIETLGALLAIVSYERGTDGNVASSASSTFADADATNLVISFTVPATGKVLVEASLLVRNDTAGGTCRCNLREGSSDLAGTDQRMTAASDSVNQDEVKAYFAAYVTGLTPGDAKTYKIGIARDGSVGNAQIRGGPGLGPNVIKVTTAP